MKHKVGGPVLGFAFGGRHVHAAGNAAQRFAIDGGRAVFDRYRTGQVGRRHGAHFGVVGIVVGEGRGGIQVADHVQILRGRMHQIDVEQRVLGGLGLESQRSLVRVGVFVAVGIEDAQVVVETRLALALQISGVGAFKVGHVGAGSRADVAGESNAVEVGLGIQ